MTGGRTPMGETGWCDETLRQGAPRDLGIVERCAGLGKNVVGGFKIGHGLNTNPRHHR